MGGLVDLYGQRVRHAGRLGVVSFRGGMAGVADAYTAYKAISDKISAYYQGIAALEGPRGGVLGSGDEEASVSATDWRNAIADLRNAVTQAPFNTQDVASSMADSYTSAGLLQSFSQTDTLAALTAWQKMLDADYKAVGAAPATTTDGGFTIRPRGSAPAQDGGLTCWPGYGLKDGACAPTPTAYAGGAAIGAVILAGIGWAIKGTTGAAIGAAVGAAAGAGGVYAASMTEAAKTPK